MDRSTKGIKIIISACNTLKGTVDAIVDGAVNSEVTLRLASGAIVYAVITIESVRSLGLVPGKTAYALFKPSWVLLTLTDEKFAMSARNRLCGTVSRVIKGAVNTEVILDLGNDNALAAIITNESQNWLQFSIGKSACGLIKASHVLLAIDS
ncbi:MAG: TOBE domain-containing protein [Candidatus Nitrotoga sp.]